MKITKEEIEELNKKIHEESEKEYNDFVLNFKIGKCYSCNENLLTFEINKPCFHWLLYPDGIKKKNFGILLKGVGCFRLMSYLRWVANQETPFININDLKVESKESRVFETTMRYNDKEWTFCCNKSDLEGHGRFKFPHYHFNMNVDGKRFINFHDFHIKLDEEDLFKINIILGKNDKFSHSWLRGAGMQDLMDLPPDFLIDSLKSSNDESKSSFRLQSMIEAKPGGTINGNDIQDIIDESKKTGRTLVSLLRERLKDVSIKTIISPGDGVAELNKRYSRGNKKQEEANQGAGRQG